MVKINSGDDLAKDIGCKPDHLAATFAKYRSDAARKTDEWGKKFFHNTDF